MNILHGTWVPGDGTAFANPGRFVLWMEQLEPLGGRQAADTHPFAARATGLEALLGETLPAAALGSTLVRQETLVHLGRGYATKGRHPG
jgi:hypothetical protein